MTRDNRKSWRAESRMAAAARSANQQQSLISAGMTASIHTAAHSPHTHTHTVYCQVKSFCISSLTGKIGQSSIRETEALSGYMKTTNKHSKRYAQRDRQSFRHKEPKERLKEQREEGTR